MHCKIKKTLLIRDLPALNDHKLAARNFFSTSNLYFFQQISLSLFVVIYFFSVITFLIWY